MTKSTLRLIQIVGLLGLLLVGAYAGSKLSNAVANASQARSQAYSQAVD